MSTKYTYNHTREKFKQMSDTKYLDIDGNELRVGDEVEIIEGGSWELITDKRTIRSFDVGSFEKYKNAPMLNDNIGMGIPCQCVRLVRRAFCVGDVVRDKTNGWHGIVMSIGYDGLPSSFDPPVGCLSSNLERLVVVCNVADKLPPAPDPNPWPEMYYHNNGIAYRVRLSINEVVVIGCQHINMEQVGQLYKICSKILDWKKKEDAK